MLADVARALESLVDQTLALMNAGAPLDEILHSVRVPGDLADRPYLQATYDEPEFVVRNIWRLYGGWWDGDAANLKPAPAAKLAAEIASLTGGAGPLMDRAVLLSQSGEHRLACHLADFAVQRGGDARAAPRGTPRSTGPGATTSAPSWRSASSGPPPRSRGPGAGRGLSAPLR